MHGMMPCIAINKQDKKLVHYCFAKQSQSKGMNICRYIEACIYTDDIDTLDEIYDKYVLDDLEHSDISARAINFAFKCGKYEIVEYFIGKGGYFNSTSAVNLIKSDKLNVGLVLRLCHEIKQSINWTQVLIAAMEIGNDILVEHFKQMERIDWRKVLHRTCHLENLEYFKLARIKDNGITTNNTIAYKAIQSGQIKILQLLYEEGYIFTAELMKFLRSVSKVETLQFVHEKIQNPEEITIEHWNDIMINAVYQSLIDIVRYCLVQKDVDVNAAFEVCTNIPIARLLLKHGSNNFIEAMNCKIGPYVYDCFVEYIAFLFEIGNYDIEECFCYALANGNFQYAKFFVRHGAKDFVRACRYIDDFFGHRSSRPSIREFLDKQENS